MIDTGILLAWGATYKKLSTGETIFREGTEAHFYYQLESGSVRWVNITEDGKEFIQNMIEAGECFGELPLFDDLPYAASAVANKDSVILRLHKNTFHQLLKEQPEIHFKFSKHLTECLRFKLMFIKELANASPEHTIKSLFSYFKEKKRHICLNCNKVQLTRQQIADMTGLRVETVIRAIRHLQDKGLLTIDRGKVYC
ncbi:MAG: Crp/Fnr family transcriptional regulator [Bacteroidetes bacterium]|nr:Crp/Fnr family transcriptional regulator [Bacteroidota bacterium]